MGFWNQKTFCVIAGASRGIGQGIAVTFSKRLSPGSVILLLSRSVSGLESTKSMIISESPNISVVTHSIDLSSPNKELFTSALLSGFKDSSTEPSQFQQFILVQVAASLGIDRGLSVSEVDDVSYVKSYFDFNITSFILLNSCFTSITPEGGKCLIVHISSHGAVTPYKTWGLYCAARAAKDMLLRSVALESPHIHTLNYAPGVVDTDNYSEALQFTKDPELVKAFQEEKEKGNLLTPRQTAEALADILEMEKFVKGEHVSYDDFQEMKLRKENEH